MSRTLKAVEICSRALRLIGKFPVTDTAPDGEDLREALHWLDLLMAEHAGTGRRFFLIPAEPMRIPLVADTATYDLADDVQNVPADGFQFPVDAVLEDEQGNRTPLTIVARDTWDAKTNMATSGAPCEVFIDRLAAEPKLSVYPVPAESDLWTVVLNVQTYAPNVAPAGVSGSRPQGATETNYRQAWQRWLIYRLAIDLGNGAIVHLPLDRIASYERQARAAELELDAYENREHDTEAPVAQPYGMDC